MKSAWVTPLLCALLVSLLASQAASQQSTGAPVVVPRAQRFDITSRINGQTYRIMVSTPFMADPAVAYPVLYVLDGNQYFGTASELMTHQSLRSRTVPPAIVVGIGYPTEDPDEVTRRRLFELSPSVSKRPEDAGVRTGGGQAFLRMIEEEVKPFVMARYNVDRTKQIVFGHSLGGLMVLRALFTNPTAFSTYIVSSPSIWWNKGEVLADEAAFSKRARAGELRLKILVTAAADEQYRGDDPKLLAAAAGSRMVDNASELAIRLAALDPKNIMVVRTIFPDETHTTVPQASLNRALRFALQP